MIAWLRYVLRDPWDFANPDAVARWPKPIRAAGPQGQRPTAGALLMTNEQRMLELAARSRMRALENLLDGLPPYPPGSEIRKMQDELASLKAQSTDTSEGRDQ